MNDYAPDAEERMGIDRIDILLAERQELIERSAEMAAKYGKFGTFPDIRKAEVSRIKMMLRAQAVGGKVKKTEAQLDDEAHAHPDYTDLLTEATLAKASWIKIEARISAIDTRIARGNLIGRFRTAEARL